MLETRTDALMTRRRFLSTSAMVAGTTLGGSALLAACGGPTSGSPSAPTQLQLIIPGDAPTGLSSVVDAVNKKLLAEKNITIKIQFIGWTNYGNQTLLKYTSGERFDASLDAPWLHINQLIASKAILPLDDYLKSGKYPNLKASIPQQIWDHNTFYGKIYGIPQPNAVSTMQFGFMTRKDLADKYGITIQTFDDFERYLYAVKQHEKGIIPYGMDNGYVTSAPSMFNRLTWQSLPPSQVFLSIASGGSGTYASVPASDLHAPVQPFWEVPGYTEALKTIRKYYQDGILNHNLLSVDKNEVWGLYTQGKFAAGVATADGLATSQYGATLKNVPGSALEVVFPFSQPLPQIYTKFTVANYLVINKRSPHPEAVLAFEDWISIKENHDLLEYGVPGKDWKPVGEDQYETLSQYSFPGYTMSYRPALERTPSNMLPSDKQWFQFTQDASHFTLDPTADFTFDVTPVKSQIAAMQAADTQYNKPLVAGQVDPVAGLDQYKQAYDKAGYQQVLQEIQKQFSAWLAQKKNRGG
jgi:putative aldouronate transport system substrate-binding protein